MIKLAIIGAGNRGMEVYGELALKYSGDVKVVSVVEPDDFKREECARRHSIHKELCFKAHEDFFKKDRLADAVIIANPDKEHYEPARLAITKGYNVLLEKPMAVDAEEVRELTLLAKAHPDRILMVSHVLRYTPFFQELKKLIDSNRIGKLVSIQHNENIGYYHFAHSYVRGNWRRVAESSPLILAKSCHDMDILLWLTQSRCTRIASFGGLAYFKSENAPDYAAHRCIDCRGIKSCPYSAYSIYREPDKWPSSVAAPSKTQQELERNLNEGPYGRCVYYCDNDTIDHMSMIMEFENGVSAVFNLSAFTANISRTIKIMGTHGEIRGDMHKNEIEVSIFGKETDIIIPEVVQGGHGGGDSKLFEGFINSLKDNKHKSLTSFELSAESHLMAFAAEESRIAKKIINMSEFYR